MIKEFADDSQQDAHHQFQRWRHAHPTGFFINSGNGTTYLLHKDLCPHPGGTEWGADSGASLTRKRKICSTTIAELDGWVLSHGLSLRHCKDCAPAEATGDYIAYHSSKLMGRGYGPPAGRFHFYSKKSESFLRRSVGCRVWVIVSTLIGSRTSYRLVGMFTPSVIRPQHDGFGILGEGIPFRPPFEVTTLPWFAELLREQNRFSYGFNRIRSPKIVAELQRLLEQDGRETVLQPDEVAVPSQLLEGATRQVGWLHQMKDILLKARLTEAERLALAALCDGPCSAQGLAERLDLPHLVQANRLLGRAGHKVFAACPVGSHVRGWHPQGWDVGWYHILAPGRRSEVDKLFYWELRPMVKKALVSLGWYAPPRTKRTTSGDGFDLRYEGAEVMRFLSTRERDPELRVACIKIHGCRCAVCGVDLGEVYGSLGRDFIHVHHLHPLAAGTTSRATEPTTDLIPVCPNCHSIIHRGGACRTPEEVRRHLRKSNKTLQRTGASRFAQSEIRTSSAAGSRR